MIGILLVDKPKGRSSHDAIHALRRQFHTKRIGHAGTLDPEATGLLVVAVGPATRFLQYLPLEPKLYRAQITFGTETSTYDVEGEVVAEQPLPPDFETMLRDVATGFVGLIQQVPPMFSAIKRD